MKFPFLDIYSGPWKQDLTSYTPFLSFVFISWQARHPHEICNEIFKATFERSQWNTQGYVWKFCNKMLWVSVEKSQWNTQGYMWKPTMKCAGYVMKNCNEMHWISNGKSQWNTQGYIWKIAMKCTGYVMKGTMYLLKNCHWDGLTELWNASREFLTFYEKSQAI